MGLRVMGDQSLPVRSGSKDRVSHIPEGMHGWRGGAIPTVINPSLSEP